MESVTVVDDNFTSLLDSQNYSKILRKGLVSTVYFLDILGILKIPYLQVL